MVDLPPGYRLFAYDSIDSTNEEARRLVTSGQAGNFAVWSKAQSAGRGRRGREWVSKEGNLYLSIVVRPDAPLAEASQLSFAAALAVKSTLEQLSINGQEKPLFTLKWPNDVLLGGSKISGILLEGGARDGNQTDYLIVGIGVNLQHHPEDTIYPATNMHDSTVVSLDTETVMATLVQEFDTYYQSWLSWGFQPLRIAWLASAHRLGEMIDVQQNDKRISGVMSDLDETGALQLRTEDGKTLVIHAGDVYFPDNE